MTKIFFLMNILTILFEIRMYQIPYCLGKSPRYLLSLYLCNMILICFCLTDTMKMTYLLKILYLKKVIVMKYSAKI